MVNHRSIFLLIISLLLNSSFLQAQDTKQLHIKAQFDTIQERVVAEVDQLIHLSADLDTLFLNAIRIDVEEFRINGEEVDFEQNDTAIYIIFLKQECDIQLHIKYSAHPRKGIYFIGWQDESRRARRQIWTQGQGIDHRHWIPHIDDQKDKLKFSAEWIFNADYQVMSNGKLDSTTIENGQKHWFYSMDKAMSSYLIALAIDKYQVSEQHVLGTEHQLYHYPERIGDSAWYYYKHQEIASFLEKEINYKYPWSNYKQAPVMDFRHGAMENTCATIFGDFFLVDSISFNDRNYTYVDAHEFAHQWFGNLVTAAGSEHHWLHEGFATYYQWLSEEHLYGRDYFEWELEKAKELAFSATEQGPLPLAHPKAGSYRFYQKGGWLLYMLRNYVGDAIYRKVINEYLNTYAYKVVQNEDLIALFKKHSDKDIDGFFDAWLYADREPILEIKEQESTLEIHSNMAFPQALEIAIFHDGVWGRSTHIVDSGLYRIALLPNTTNWYVSNADDLLIQIKEDIPWTKAQGRFEHQADYLDRYYTLKNVHLERNGDLEHWLKEVLLDSTEHFSVRAEALKHYYRLKRDAATVNQVLAKSTDVNLQKEVLDYSLEEEVKLEAEVLKQLREEGRSYDLRAKAIQASINPRDPQSNLWLKDQRWKEQPGTMGHNVYINTLFFRVALMADKEAYVALLDFAGPSFDFNTRMNALRFFGYLGVNDEVYIKQLFEAFFNSNWKLVKMGREKLLEIQQSEPELFEEVYEDLSKNWNDFQKRKAARTFEDE